MKEIFLKMKAKLAGNWSGEGHAKFPTIKGTAYTEQTEFIADEYKDAIYFNQKTWYKNTSASNDHTVFWDTGFIILKEDKIVLHSVQVSGRMEMFELINHANDSYTFNSVAILNDIISIRSQRIFTVENNVLQYALNMATHDAEFQNHLTAHLKK